MKAHLNALFQSYAEIFFLQNPIVGVLLCALTLLNPTVGLAGLLAVVAAYAVARLIRMDRAFLESGFYTYNPLLVGLSLGHLFQFTPLTAFLVVAAGALTLLLTVCTAHLFIVHLRLPILSLPFALVSTIAYMASLRYSNLLHNGSPLPPSLTETFGLPVWIAGFCKAWGALMFTPSVLVGGAFALVVLARSRILFLLAVMGYLVGATMRRFMLGSPIQAYEDLLNFNFILIAMAVGGVFMVPSARSYLIALIAVAVSTLVMDAITGFWSYSGIPAFTLPFNLVCLGTLYALGLVGEPLIARRIGRTPEETLDDSLATGLRYPGSERTLLPPFAGRWTVWQGFNGRWTHKGAWRYAYDFVITDDSGRTSSDAGTELTDYLCFNKPVLAPVRGRVVQVVNELPDNPIGQPDTVNNWGNLVIIQDPRGFHVALSHFAQDSITVKAGDWIERGRVLGRCGNSGYSPEPHIHVHAQLADSPGAASVPFSFVSYLDHGVFHANDLPPEESRIEPLYANRRLENQLNFALDEEYRYDVRHRDRSLDELRLCVRMEVDGTFYFDSGRARLYFGRHEGTFYFYRLTGRDPRLEPLMLALPRLPLAYRESLTWHDHLPAGLVTSGWRTLFTGLASSFWARLAEVRVSLRFAGETVVESTVESRLLTTPQNGRVTFGHQKGFASVVFGEWQLTRKDDAG
jgi:urea transporter